MFGVPVAARLGAEQVASAVRYLDEPVVDNVKLLHIATTEWISEYRRIPQSNIILDSEQVLAITELAYKIE